MNVIRYEKDADNIVHMILDRPEASANLMDVHFTDSLDAFMAKFREDESAVGIIVESTKKTFFAGGDLDSLYSVTPEIADQLFEGVEHTKRLMRELETQGKPVVACINGAALGGGWELALVCHHRICLSKGVTLGLPEVTLGLLPGGGGVVRMTRLLGLLGAQPYLMEGRQFKPEKGVELGLIHGIADDRDAMLAQAKDFILNNPEVQQPYDVKGYKVPGGKPSHPALAQMLPIAPAVLRQQTHGVMPAPESILCTAVESLQVDIETATRIESRYFAELAAGKVSKNMIGTFWYQLNAIKAGASRPNAEASAPVARVGILGAGMMGAGIALSCASKGIDVVLKDIDQEAADRGKAYSETQLQKKVSRGRLSQDKCDATLARIHPTAQVDDLSECELIIEAVFENVDLKATVTQETESVIAPSATFASNTSTLPITGLAKASSRPNQFIGLHFFSPAEKMPLVEIICGAETDDATLAKAYDFVLQIGKTPIVVGDNRGFFTSRVFGCFAQEGIRMVAEGVAPASIENAAFLCGFPVGPLAVSDEVSMTLMEKIRKTTIAALETEGKHYEPTVADATVDRMLEIGRAGKLAGAGFYDYPEGGKKHLWSGLGETFDSEENRNISLQDIKDRLLFVKVIDSVRCMDEGTIHSVRDANIGSIMGIGFPPWTGGVLQFINYYGVAEFVGRAQELADKYGNRFEPPARLKAMAETGEQFTDA